MEIILDCEFLHVGTDLGIMRIYKNDKVVLILCNRSSILVLAFSRHKEIGRKSQMCCIVCICSSRISCRIKNKMIQTKLFTSAHDNRGFPILERSGWILLGI